jgi:transcriptional regulator with XRE-family HTH domain
MPEIARTAVASRVQHHPRTLRLVAPPSFLECVGAVAREHRDCAEAQLIDISFWSRASQGTVSRFENGESQPRDLDRLLTAYAKVSGVPAGELLREATARWEQGGGAVEPELTQIVPGQARPAAEAAQALEAVAERDRRAPDSSAAGPRGRGRRRASE